MQRLPDMLYIVDVRREATAVKEANRLGIPIVAMVDTNCDPTPIDYVIPANDDAIRAIKLITSKIADAVIEGQRMREIALAEELGDLFLVLTSLARLLEFEPEGLVRAANRKFDCRFREMERMAAEKGTSLEKLSLEEKESLWQAAKK